MKLACERKAVSVDHKSAHGFAALYTVPCIYHMQISNDHIAGPARAVWLRLHEPMDTLNRH